MGTEDGDTNNHCSWHSAPWSSLNIEWLSPVTSIINVMVYCRQSSQSDSLKYDRYYITLLLCAVQWIPMLPTRKVRALHPMVWVYGTWLCLLRHLTSLSLPFLLCSNLTGLCGVSSMQKSGVPLRTFPPVVPHAWMLIFPYSHIIQVSAQMSPLQEGLPWLPLSKLAPVATMFCPLISLIFLTHKHTFICLKPVSPSRI